MAITTERGRVRFRGNGACQTDQSRIRRAALTSSPGPKRLPRPLCCGSRQPKTWASITGSTGREKYSDPASDQAALTRQEKRETSDGVHRRQAEASTSSSAPAFLCRAQDQNYLRSHRSTEVLHPASDFGAANATRPKATTIPHGIFAHARLLRIRPDLPVNCWRNNLTRPAMHCRTGESKRKK